MHDPIFVAGSGRSGTTILGRTLGLHPQVFGLRDESRFLVAPRGSLLEWTFDPHNVVLARAFRQRIAGGFFNGEAVRELVDCPPAANPGEIFKRLARGGFYTRPLAHTPYPVGLCRDVEYVHYRGVVEQFLANFPQDALDDRLRAVSSLCHELFLPSMNASGATRWCDDTPRNALYLVELARVFPDLRIVHMIRDGRDVARSFPRLGWLPSRRAALHMWFEHVGIARRAGASLGPDRYREILFEDLTRDPDRVLREILEFLGLPWLPEMDAHAVRAEVARRERESDPELDALFLALAGDLVEEFGWTR